MLVNALKEGQLLYPPGKRLVRLAEKARIFYGHCCLVGKGNEQFQIFGCENAGLKPVVHVGSADGASAGPQGSTHDGTKTETDNALAAGETRVVLSIIRQNRLAAVHRSPDDGATDLH